MNKIIIEPDKVEEYKSDAIENICKNIANEMDLKVFKEQQELTKMWEEKYYQTKKERNKQKEILDKIKENIENNKYKKMGGYGDNEDEDIEVCLFEDDIWKIEELLEEIE